jgi:hypothetical protein
LEKHYHAELSTGADIANAKVAGRLFAQANSEDNSQANTIARIFWLKARARWRESQLIEHAGADGAPLPDQPNNNVFLIPDNGRDPDLVARLPPVPAHIREMFNAPPKLLESRAVKVEVGE